MIKSIRKSALEYFELNFVLTKYHQCATFMHPILKKLSNVSAREKVLMLGQISNTIIDWCLVYNDIGESARSVTSQPEPMPSTSNSNHTDNGEPPRKRRSTEINIYEQFSNISDSSTTSETDNFDNMSRAKVTIQKEIQDYVDEILQFEDPADFEVLKWWNVHSGRFIHLPKFARFIHSIPASSASSERNFSTCGNIISEKRTNILPETVLINPNPYEL